MLSLVACLLLATSSAILDCENGIGSDCQIDVENPIIQRIQALLNGIDLLSWYKDWLKGFEVDYIDVSDLRDSYDFIVIGAGVGGSVVAHRLAIDPSHPSVLLLEAGDKADNSGLSFEMVPTFTGENQLKEGIDWAYNSQPSNYCCQWHINKSHYMPRGKVMGGSGVLNYMLWVRGHKDDWDELMNIDDWKYDDVLPYFQKCESLSTHAYDGIRNNSMRGYDGPIIVNSVNELKDKESIFEEAVIRACEEAGIPFLRYGQNTGDNIGIAVSEFNIDDDGHRSGPFVAYNEYMRNVYKTEYEQGLIRLDILPEAYVTKILFDDTKTRATGVTFIDTSDKLFPFRENKEYTIKLSSSTKGEVILSGGAFNSPQLLMLSGIGPKEELDECDIDVIQDLPGVGQNLQDHPWVQLRYHFAEEYKDQAFTQDKVLDILTDFDKFKQYLLKGRGPLATSGVQLTAFIKSNLSTDTFPDLQLYFLPGLTANPEQFNYKENIYIDNECGDKEYYTDLDNVENIGTFVGLQHPESKGYVKLQSKDPFEYPLIQPNYLKEQIDVDKLKYGIKKLDEVMQQTSMKRLWDARMDCKKYGDIFSDDEALEQYIRDSVANIYHPIGTCKMGDLENDEMAVVDNRLKVKGIDNLRIVDASILPFQTSGNTQVPVFMIGERASEFILQEYSDRA